MLLLHQIILYVLKESFRKNVKDSHDNCYKIRDEKLQHAINREAAKISALSSGKIDKYEYLTGEEIQVKNDRTSYVYLFPFRKSFGKTNKNNWLNLMYL